jgi:hypothetical protein
MKRPVAVTILAIVAVLAGLANILDVLVYLSILPAASLGPIDFFGVSILGAIMAGLVAAIWFWAAKMLWTLDPRGWLFAVAIATINLVFVAAAVIGKSSIQAMMPLIILNGVALILGLLPGTKAAFGQK